MVHITVAVDLIKSGSFDQWLTGLRDVRARAKVLVRIERLAAGNPGDVRSVGGGISELRIDYGPGYRGYLIKIGRVLIVLLAGGDKTTQQNDIEAAKAVAAQWKALP